MASRLWNQINSVKYLKNGTLRTYSSVADRSQLALNKSFKRQSLDFCSSPESGLRNLSASKDLSSSVEPSTSGRFVRNAPGPFKPSDAGLRPALRYRIAHGAKQVAKNAQDALRSRCDATYTLRDGSGIVPNDGHIQAWKRKFQRKQTVSRLQPHSMIPFCSKQVPSLEREDIRPTKFIAIKVPRRQMSTSSCLTKRAERDYEVEDTMSIRSDMSYGSNYSVDSIGSAASTGSAVSTDAIDAITPPPPPPPPPQPSQNLTNTVNKPGPSTEKTHVGFNYTQLNMSRPFSTLSRQGAQQTEIVPNVTNARMRHKRSKPDCEPIMCGQKVMSKKEIADGKCMKMPVYKHKGRWDKCECCPEMLPCDETTCTYVYPFPCPCEKYPIMCPIDCPPPCEPPPPRPVPLCRPPKCPVFQKMEEPSTGCPPESCVYVEPRKLRKIESDCFCVEPYVPDKLPKLSITKKHVYQTQPCPAPPCCEDCVDNIVAPKKLPPIIPGDCPCIEPEIYDVPPLRRLNMEAYQKVPECKPSCKIEPQILKCIEKRKLRNIPSPCKKIEPPPLKHVPLVRLPPICVCPPPPDPKCDRSDKCALRSDEQCEWEFPKKKLKNWWCPKCKIPKSKYKWCNCHTRGNKNCREWKCKRCMCTMCMNQGTCTVRNFSSFARKGENQASNKQLPTAMVTGKCPPGSSIVKRINLTRINTTSPLMLRSFHVSTTFAKKDCKKEKKKVKKVVDCGPLCGSVCCEPRARDSCKINLPPLCCKVKKAPYPAFSECGEFAQLLSCECRHSMPYLQPQMQQATHFDRILKEPTPKWKIIDPVHEEHCVLHDLCRPTGHTYTCETFHKGEVVPITQYECFSPHRLPCCERDQICDFKFRKAARKCDGNKKEREYYRCECACAQKKKKCKSIDAHHLNTTTSKIRKHGQRTARDNFVDSKRRFSTLASRRHFEVQPRCNALPMMTPESLPSTSAGVAGFHNSAVVTKECGAKKCKSKCTPKCPHSCKRKKKQQCGCPMRPSHQPQSIPRQKCPESTLLSSKLQGHFKKSQECTEGGGRRRLLMAQAKCAAKRVGMKLTPDHESCCKHKKMSCSDKIAKAKKCESMAECKRPKNVCCECDPRYEVDECRGHSWIAPCCDMKTGRTSGEDFRAMQPDCCKMPLPPCQECMRVRGDCSVDYIPCCVTEAPFPAFSDCHPPFKRLIRSECQMQELLDEIAQRKIAKMLNPTSMGKRYSTATPAGLLSTVIEEEPCDIAPKPKTVVDKVKALFAVKIEGVGLNKALDYTPTVCSSGKSSGFRNIRPDLRRNIKTALPATGEGLSIDNIPELLFDKDDIFKQVDRENLISLAPKEMTPVEKVKSYLFNKANNVMDAAAPPLKLPVDGFECFVSPAYASTAATTPTRNSTTSLNGCRSTSRRYATSKAAEELFEDDSEATKETKTTAEEQQCQQNVLRSNVVTLSKTTDLVYLLADGKNTINLSPRKSVGEKVKVIPHPVCTHIMLDSGELLLENQYHLMNTILPLKNRIYLPYGLSHEEHSALEQKSIKTVQLQLEKMLDESENS